MTEQPNEPTEETGFSDEDLEKLSKLMRALDGKPINTDEVITSLTNPKNILERSRFQTYPLLQKNVYLRLVALKHPELKAFKEWADYEAEALISHKGEGRKEWVEQRKAAAIQDAGTVIGSFSQPKIEAPPKKRFWQREQKQPKSEFVNQ